MGGAQVELKGRLSLDKAAEFFANLRRSRTRTASAALLRCGTLSSHVCSEDVSDVSL